MTFQLDTVPALLTVLALPGLSMLIKSDVPSYLAGHTSDIFVSREKTGAVANKAHT